MIVGPPPGIPKPLSMYTVYEYSVVRPAAGQLFSDLFDEGSPAGPTRLVIHFCLCSLRKSTTCHPASHKEHL